jgi:type IV pilus assembly protein PilC
MKEDGTKIEGEFEGNSREAVLTMVTSNGYYPLKIEEIIESQKVEFNIGGKVKSKDLSIFCRQMYTMLDAGVSITNCLNLLGQQITNKKLKVSILDLEESVKKGEMVSDAMKRHKNVFPGLLRSMVESGEVSGSLDEMMLRLSTHYEKENKTVGKVKSAMIYPIILAIICVCAVTGILTFVMPTFVDLFESSGSELPLMTKIVVGLSKFLNNNIILITLATIAAAVGIAFYKKTESGIYFFCKLSLSIPIYKDLTKKVIVARFTRTLSTLLASGVSLIQALPIVGAVLGNKIAEDALVTIRERVARGEGLSDPIRVEKIFPPMLASMVKIGEESGSLDDILNKTADFYDDEVDQAVTRTTAMLEPILIVVMGVLIGCIVMAIMIPMFSMYDKI